MLSSRAAVALTTITIVLASAPLGAQESAAALVPGGATLAGIVYDSLHWRPLAGARVQLVPAGPRTGPTLAVEADSLGTFRFDGLTPGRYAIGFMHHAVDALGFSEQAWSVEVRGDSVHYVMLSLPSASGIRARFCAPPSEDDSTGMLLGIVRDPDTGAPLADASVIVLWNELTVGARALRHEQQRFPGKSNADGRYMFCSLPTEGTILARAELDDRASGYLELQIPPRGLLHRDFTIPGDSASIAVAMDSTIAPGTEPPRRGTARLTGRAIGPDGEPIVGAQISVLGSLGRGTTGSDGAFTLVALPAGTHMLDARVLGYEPERVVVELVSGQTSTVTVHFAGRVQELESVLVYGKRSRRMLDVLGFEERRRRGNGHYFTVDDIRKRRPLHVSALLQGLPGMHVDRPGVGASIRMRGPGGQCSPTIFIDGVQLAIPSDLDVTVKPDEITGIEVYSMAQTPAEFMRQYDKRVACGAVVIWAGAGPRNPRR